MARRGWRCGLACAAFLGAVSPVWADFVLDWGVTSPATWSDTTGPSFTQSFDIDSAHAGSEVTVTITDSSGRMVSGYPAINSAITGGTGSGNKSLELAVDFATSSQSLTVTVAFNTSWAPQGVEDLAFTLFDVDQGSMFTFFGIPFYTYTDEISNIQGIDASGSTIAATAVIGSSGNSVSGSGVGYTVDGTASVPDGNSANGNVTISFSNSAVQQVSFTVGNGSGTWLFPGEQTLALGDLHGRRKIPEYHPAWAACLLCGLLMAGHGWRRWRFAV